MKSIKKIVIFILCAVLCVYGLSVSAADSGKPTITVSKVKASPDDTVSINIEISNNPGIMAMSFSITYDSTAFEYDGYKKGFLKSYTIKDHPEQNYVAFVNVESSDIAQNGVLLTLQFKVKSNAAAGTHVIGIANNNQKKYGKSLENSFSDSKQKYIVPTVTEGFIDVARTCANSPHEYGKTTEITKPTCTSEGVGSHTCTRCNYSENVVIEKLPHDFEENWTVDTAATKESDGIMSRHCKNCDAVTDKITFTYKEVEDSKGDGDDKSASNTDSKSESSSNNTEPSQTAESKSNSNSDANITGNMPIKNTAGAKNSVSAVEKTKDYQENVKPNKETADENLDTAQSISATDDTASRLDITDSTDILLDKSKNSAKKWIVISAITALSVAVITAVMLFIIKRKKR